MIDNNIQKLHQLIQLAVMCRIIWWNTTKSDVQYCILFTKMKKLL